MFERDLKERFSHQRELTYDVQQLFQWMDHLVSLSFSSHTVSSALLGCTAVLLYSCVQRCPCLKDHHSHMYSVLTRSLLSVQHDLSALV